MSDLVERLRETAKAIIALYGNVANTCDEAADRIEELEAEVADLQEAVKIYKKTLKDKQECMNALTGWR